MNGLLQQATNVWILLAVIAFTPLLGTVLAGGQPNIVFNVSDDHDSEHLGFMGNGFAHTPNLDRLARTEGLQACLNGFKKLTWRDSDPATWARRQNVNRLAGGSPSTPVRPGVDLPSIAEAGLGETLNSVLFPKRNGVGAGVVATRLRGYEVSLSDNANNQGIDLFVDGQSFQVKCYGDSGAAMAALGEHFEKFPDIPVYVNGKVIASRTGYPSFFAPVVRSL